MKYKKLSVNELGSANQKENSDITELHKSLVPLIANANDESSCINLFIVETHNNLKRLPKTKLCFNEQHAEKLDYFLHFRSLANFKDFVNEAHGLVNQSKSEVYAFLTHQRFSLLHRKAYLESEIYRIEKDDVRYMGKIKSDG